MLLLVMMGLFMRLRVPPDNMVQDDINAIWGPEALFHDNAQEELPPDEEFRTQCRLRILDFLMKFGGILTIRWIKIAISNPADEKTLPKSEKSKSITVFIMY